MKGRSRSILLPSKLLDYEALFDALAYFASRNHSRGSVTGFDVNWKWIDSSFFEKWASRILVLLITLPLIPMLFLERVQYGLDLENIGLVVITGVLVWFLKVQFFSSSNQLNVKATDMELWFTVENKETVLQWKSIRSLVCTPDNGNIITFIGEDGDELLVEYLHSFPGLSFLLAMEARKRGIDILVDAEGELLPA